MPVTSLVSKPFEWLSHARSARVFHPDGLVCSGYAALSGDTPLPVRSGPVTARVSKGVGTPGGLPDIVGLAVRLPVEPSVDDDGNSHAVWDLLLAGPAPLGGRLPLPLPTFRWPGATVSSLTPFRHDDTLYWIRARFIEPDDLSGLSLDELRKAVYAGRPIVAVVEVARGGAEFVAVLRLDLDVLADPDFDFDPVIRTPASVELAPSWLATLRKEAYRYSRIGRERA
ncbi:hypothetical protein V1Y59_19975 [Gordonia sp. PKS22-38]|uniref:Phosphodiesterase n=1 Tax=Gordonia prachuapensis TaxID=3115651 RepID=A0ABU7N026_9ACTN|nr:hypothetical protein [Gordonia sp. PKS22-38]